MHLLHVFPAFERGGAQLRTTAWINRLGPGFRHGIVSLNGDLSCRNRLDPGVAVEFPAPPTARGGPAGRLLALGAFLRRLAPDVLVTNNWGSIEWVCAGRLLARCRLLHVESGFGSEEAAADFPRRALARRLLLAGRVRVIVPSERLRERALAGWGLDPARVSLVRDGIDCRRFADAADRTPRPLRPFTVGTVAVLREEKRIDLLLEAFARLRRAVPARLIVVGDGPERAGLEARAAALGLAEVHFTGFVDAVEQAYPWFDAFALSSETEQTPNSVLQAMAAGLPVAATRVGDVAAMLAEENAAWIVPVHDAAALADALARLAADPAARARVGAANRARAFARFDLDAMVAGYRRLLTSPSA
jgi:glycosyltransferase involved in cell wall biosynthesis